MVEQVYIDVIVESICSTAVWLYKADVTYYSMLAFGGYDLKQATLFAILGACIGSVSNYGLGWLLSAMQFNGKSVIAQEKYDRWRKNAYFIAPLIAAITWLPLVGALVVGLGFLRLRALYMVPLLILPLVAYYLVQLENAGGF